MDGMIKGKLEDLTGDEIFNLILNTESKVKSKMKDCYDINEAILDRACDLVVFSVFIAEKGLSDEFKIYQEMFIEKIS